VCKKTQNFVKKKLKAFPSRLDSFYTNKNWCYCYGHGQHLHNLGILQDGQNDSGTQCDGYTDVMELSEATEGSGKHYERQHKRIKHINASKQQKPTKSGSPHQRRLGLNL